MRTSHDTVSRPLTRIQSAQHTHSLSTDEEEISEISRLLSEPPGSGGIPASELHPLVKDYLQVIQTVTEISSALVRLSMATTDSNNQDNVLRPSMIEMIKDSIDRKSKNLRRIFLNWDHDQDGFIDATEMRKGQFSDA